MSPHAETKIRTQLARRILLAVAFGAVLLALAPTATAWKLTGDQKLAALGCDDHGCYVGICYPTFHDDSFLPDYDEDYGVVIYVTFVDESSPGEYVLGRESVGYKRDNSCP